MEKEKEKKRRRGRKKIETGIGPMRQKIIYTVNFNVD